MKKLLLITLLISVNCLLHSQITSVSDIDGNSYPTIKIGNQIWMAANLNVTHFPNGDTVKSYCYNNSEDYCEKYGRLYSWKSLIKINEEDTIQICPDGWSIPTDDNWNELEKSSGGESAAAQFLKKPENDFGFQWGGNYHEELDVFSFIDKNSYFWTMSSYSKSTAWMRMTGVSMKNINRSTVPKEYCFSIRCIKNQD